MTAEFVAVCVTVAGTILGSVALVAHAKKPSPDPVVDVKLAHGEKTMDGLGEDIEKLWDYLASLGKEVAEVRHGQNNIKTRMDGITKQIDEMPAKVARIIKALG